MSDLTDRLGALALKWHSGNLLDAIEDIKTMEADLELAVDLLNCIHCDDGEQTDAVGFAKSYADAAARIEAQRTHYEMMRMVLHGLNPYLDSIGAMPVVIKARTVMKLGPL